MSEPGRAEGKTQLVETVLQDARHGWRGLVRTPGFTIAVVLTLALAIGANTAIFTVVNAVLLAPLPFPEPDRLVSLVRHTSGGPGQTQDGRRYLFFRDHVGRTVEVLTAYSGLGSMNLVAGDTAELVSTTGISKEYFRVFGVQPAIGRPFGNEHDADGGPDVAILTHAIWQRLFGADPGIAGSVAQLGDRPFTILGVMPASFEPPSATDVFLPLRPGLTGRGAGFNYTVVGRLRDGASRDQANAEAASLWQAFAREYPAAVIATERQAGFLSLQETRALPVRSALLVLTAAVGVLLLIACGNTANLLLARTSDRQREIAVRSALGAPRGRIIRQVLTESLILAMMGATLGLALAYWLVPALLSLTPPAFLVTDDVRIDGTVLIATMIVALGTGLLFGVAPASSASRADLVGTFKADGARSIGSRQSGWLRRSLAVSEVALCMLLLVGAGLLLQTFLKLRAVDPGFDPTGVLTARMSLQGERYASPSALNHLYTEGLSRIRRIPGVRSAAVVNGLPLERALNLNVDVLDGPQAERVENELTDWRYVTPDYFETLGIRIIEGRRFTDHDGPGALPVAVVSETFAKRLFPGKSALGRHIRVFDADGSMEIVGVVNDLKEGGLRFRPRLVMYVPVAQTHEQAIRTTHSYFHVSWVVRADSVSAGLVREIEQQIRAVDPRQPFAAFRTMDEVKRRAMATERFQMTLLGAFAVIGLLLACAGTYGVIAYSVGQRTREFGIRMALGASRYRILWSVVRHGGALALVGVGLGAVGATFATRLLQNFVWGVGTLDATTFVAVAALLIVVSCGASFIPALRAIRLSPLNALRD